MKTNIRPAILCLGIAVGLELLLPLNRSMARELEQSKEIIAVQLRRQGYACGKALSATRDEKASKPDAEVWTLECNDASYRVKLIPNMAATVERLPQEQKQEEQKQEEQKQDAQP